MTRTGDVALQNQIKKIQIHLRLTYHRIIEKILNVEFQDKPLKALDPSMIWENDSRYGTGIKTIKISVLINGKRKSFRLPNNHTT